MPFSDLLPDLLLGLMSTGLAAAFLYAEPYSPTTRALAVAFLANGLEWAETPWSIRHPLRWLQYFDLFLIVAATFAFAEWLYRVARTAQASAVAMGWIMASVRLAQGLAALFLLIGWLDIDDMYGSVVEGGFAGVASANPVVLLLIAAGGCFVVGATLLFLQDVDAVERVRAVAIAVALPFLAAGLILRWEQSVLSNAVGQLVILIGAMRYHAMQGQRGAFMSRFLSRDVAKLVRDKGLEQAMQPQSLEVTIVCCDLRGFTRLCQMLASEQVVRLLGDYYDVVGRVVSEVGGTIKDYAGDGVLVLVGAPVADAEHASKGLRIARQIRDAMPALMARWAGPEMALGAGVGVATGRVTVGAVGSLARMEYMAIGPAVNLASRLCSQAKDGEILVDGRTAALLEKERLEEREAVDLKGLGAVVHFAG